MIRISPDMLAVDEIEEGSYSPEARMNLGIIGVTDDPAYDALIQSSYEWEKHVGLAALGQHEKIRPTSRPSEVSREYSQIIPVGVVNTTLLGRGPDAGWTHRASDLLDAKIRQVAPTIPGVPLSWRLSPSAVFVIMDNRLWSALEELPRRRAIPLARGRVRLLVRDLQAQLARIGTPLGPSGIDGLWGPNTRAALELVVTPDDGSPLSDHYRAAGRYIDIDRSLWEQIQNYQPDEEQSPTPPTPPAERPAKRRGGGAMLGIFGLAAILFLGSKIEMEQ